MNLFNWPFMNEPIWRWFVFVLAMTAFSFAWKIVLNEIKGA